MPTVLARALGSVSLGSIALATAYVSLDRSPVPDLVSRWWLATAVATVLLMKLPREHVRRTAIALGVGFLVVGLVTGQGVVLSLGLAVGNVVESLVVVRWVTRFEPGRAALASWTAYRRWLVGIGLGCAASAVVVTLALVGPSGNAPWNPLVWLFVCHVAAQTTVLPLFMEQPRHRVRLSPTEVGAHVVLLAAGATMCLTARPDQPLAFLLLPLLIWSAARFPPAWAKVEMYAVALGLAILSASGHGPFVPVAPDAGLLDMGATVQTFVAVAAVTAVAFMVAVCELRASLRHNREAELQLGQLLDSASGTAFIATDLDGVITWFSPGAEQLLGYRADDLVGSSDPVRFHDDREIHERARALGVAPGYAAVTAPVAAGAEQDTRDWTYLRRDGSQATVSVSVTAVRGVDGARVGFLSVVRDVTDRRAAEQAMLQALDKERETNRRMLELDRAKNEFVSSVSHELRTPLTSIVGYTEILGHDLADNLTQMQRDLVDRIDRNGERLLSLVEDLLTLARVEDGELRLDLVETDLCRPVRTAGEEVAHAARKRRIALQVRTPDHPVVLMADPGHVERLVLNLLSNAIKFTPEGGCVDLLLEVDETHAVVVVSDSGVGIPLEEQDQLFTRFFRSSTATAGAIQGTGLGLAIVRSIAQAHGGSIEVDSAPSEGTTFTFRLPLRAVVPKVVPDLDGGAAGAPLALPAGAEPTR
ncbi:hypothetical protein SAMN04488570_0219 [Nocardioides scoriae]|uniref:histidine kinase n=1 Tax=Nocardioides scoriae TaxID=642780 RepID=A0A1H1LIR4_9ACTN|nr:ATP-binding protein [Nocardioides scoriae]SDR73915.1 hypothetical protein SAMN04488570_0219 [Nocardioides scoriae]